MAAAITLLPETSSASERAEVQLSQAARTYADIFRNNCGKNGLLTIELTEEQVEEIFQTLEKEPGVKGTVDLENQKVTLHAAAGDQVYTFDVAADLKTKLLEGLDDIALTLQYEADITAYEAAHS